MYQTNPTTPQAEYRTGLELRWRSKSIGRQSNYETVKKKQGGMTFQPCRPAAIKLLPYRDVLFSKISFTVVFYLISLILLITGNDFVSPFAVQIIQITCKTKMPKVIMNPIQPPIKGIKEINIPTTYPI